MPRVNEPHSPASLQKLAADFRDAADRIDAVAKRLRTTKATSVLALAHGASIDRGLLAAGKFCREANLKLDNMEEERRRLGK